MNTKAIQQLADATLDSTAARSLAKPSRSS